MVSTQVDRIQAQHQWPGLQAVAKVTRIRETAENTSSETAYYLLSRTHLAKEFNPIVVPIGAWRTSSIGALMWL